MLDVCRNDADTLRSLEYDAITLKLAPLAYRQAARNRVKRKPRA